MPEGASDTQLFLKSIYDAVQRNGDQLEKVRKTTTDTSVTVSGLTQKVDSHIDAVKIHHEPGECAEVQNLKTEIGEHKKEHPQIVKRDIALWVGGSMIAAASGGVGILKLVELLGK